MTTKTLSEKITLFLEPKPPYNFDTTIRVPSHFPAPVEVWEPGNFWKPMRFKNKVLGIKLENLGEINKPKIKLTVFSDSNLSHEFIEDLIKELNFRYSFDEDMSEFYNKFKQDSLLKPVFKKMWGTHGRTLESLYEIIMISIVLQNATVRRTVQMMNNLLENYGQKIKFDGKEIYLIWGPQRLVKISEQELRDLKVGYRAKMFIRISEQFVKKLIDEHRLGEMSLEDAKKELLSLYGIGPASLDNLLGTIGKQQIRVLMPWEQKIFSMLLFNEKLVSPEKILNELKKRYGKHTQFATNLIFEELFWRHKEKPIPWLEKEIRL